MVWVSCLAIDFSLWFLTGVGLDMTSKNDKIYDYFFSYVLRPDINNFYLGRNRYEKKSKKSSFFLICVTSRYK